MSYEHENSNAVIEWKTREWKRLAGKRGFVALSCALFSGFSLIGTLFAC